MPTAPMAMGEIYRENVWMRFVWREDETTHDGIASPRFQRAERAFSGRAVLHMSRVFPVLAQPALMQ
jgi:hypothetical protein